MTEQNISVTDERQMQRVAAGKAGHLIADALGETELVPRAMIVRSVKALGVKRAQELLAQTQAIETGEGMLTADGTRRRTPGGVYLALVRQAASGKDRYFIFDVQRQANAAQGQ